MDHNLNQVPRRSERRNKENGQMLRFKKYVVLLGLKTAVGDGWCTQSGPPKHLARHLVPKRLI